MDGWEAKWTGRGQQTVPVRHWTALICQAYIQCIRDHLFNLIAFNLIIAKGLYLIS